MAIGSGRASYEWLDHWAKVPDTESARTEWAHHDVGVTQGGEVVTFHQDNRTVLVLGKDGDVLRSWDSGLTAAHGMVMVVEGASEYAWIADTGRTRPASQQYRATDTGQRLSGRVVKTTLDGKIIAELQEPGIPIYREGDYLPTSVAVNEERHGGNGDIWVADGYGQSYVHRYTKAGEYVGGITGEEGRGGRFSTPHGVFVDRRRSEPELYVADRANHQVQVYDLEGTFKRAFGSDFLTSPSVFAVDGDLLVVGELRARLAVLDGDDKLVTYLGSNEEVCDVPGWPNNLNDGGEIVPTSLIQHGKFNSPHGLAADSDGNLYVAEWLIGGRMVKLAKAG